MCQHPIPSRSLMIVHCTDGSHFIFSSVDGHLGCFRFQIIELFFFSYNFYLFIYFGHVARRILVPRPGIEPVPPAVGSTESSPPDRQGSPRLQSFLKPLKIQFLRSVSRGGKLGRLMWFKPGLVASAPPCDRRPQQRRPSGIMPKERRAQLKVSLIVLDTLVDLP